VLAQAIHTTIKLCSCSEGYAFNMAAALLELMAQSFPMTAVFSFGRACGLVQRAHFSSCARLLQGFTASGDADLQPQNAPGRE
jgi:hypothetical protein